MSWNELWDIPDSFQNFGSLNSLFLHGNTKLIIPKMLIGPSLSKLNAGAESSAPAEIINYCIATRGVEREAKLEKNGVSSVCVSKCAKFSHE